MKCHNSVGKTFVSQDCKAKQNPCTAQEGPTQPWLLLSQSLGCFHLWAQQPRDELRGSQEMLAKGRRQQEPQGKGGPKAELLCPPSFPCPLGRGWTGAPGLPQGGSANCCSSPHQGSPARPSNAPGSWKFTHWLWTEWGTCLTAFGLVPHGSAGKENKPVNKIF